MSKFKKYLKKMTASQALLAAAATTFLTAGAQEPTLFFISDTHLDSQWNWDVQTTIGEYVKKTMSDNFKLFDKYPAFHLNFEGSIRYRWMKEYYPEDYAKLKTYIESGRWHVSGCAVDANDVMVSSAESIMRNWLYGRVFFEEEFGVDGGNDIMLPDCFGFSYALPSLAAHCGKVGFHTAKLGWGTWMYDQLPPYGIWQGVDGSQIYAIYKPHAYDSHEEYCKDLVNDSQMLSYANDNYSKYGIPAEVRYVGPRSDHGGALADKTNNGENTPYWLNWNATNSGPLKVKLVTPDYFFDYLSKQDNSKLHVWNDELPMRNHGVGAYTSQAVLKQWNRRNELLADAAEKSAVAADWLGVAAYPRQDLREAWVTNLWQAHHDGITGTSIPKAYVWSQNDYTIANKAFGDALSNSVGAVTRMLDTQVEGVAMVVSNPLSIDRTDVAEATVTCDTKPEGVQVFDANGKEVLAQMLSYDPTTRTAHIIFAATVPSLGYAVYDVRPGQPCSLESDMTIDIVTRQISNGNFRTTLDTKGDPNLYDLKNNRLMMGFPAMQILEDRSTSFPAWEIWWDAVKADPVVVDENVKITIAENGPLRKAFRVSRTKNGSTFVHYVRMSAVSDRVDMVNEVDWQTMNSMLKIQMSSRSAFDKVTYDLSLGTIERGLRTEQHYEMQGHQWADMTVNSGAYGVSVLNDCKYGWDKPSNNQLRLTLIHTPYTGSSYSHQALQDLGSHHFTVAFFPHQNKWNESTQIEASRLNQPLTAFEAPKHEGAAGSRLSFASLNTQKVSIKALKKAERNDEYIVRVYEWTGEAQNNVTLTFPSNVTSVREVTGLEENLASAGSINVSGKSFSFNIGRYQPKTFAFTLAKPAFEAEAAAPVETHLALDFDTDMMSFNSNRKDATAGLEKIYPAEQIADEISYEGVSFAMGSRANGAKNAMSCHGQTLTFEPKQGQNKLYILAASTKADGVNADFKVGDETVSYNVPYYAGYVGQFGTKYNLGSSYRRDHVALTATHAHKLSDGKDELYNHLYIYKYLVNLPQGTTKVTLPNVSGLYIFAATLSDNTNDDTKPATEIYTYPDYEETGAKGAMLDGNGYLKPDAINQSGQVNQSEAGKMAADLNASTKWCCTSANGWLEYRYDEPVIVSRWALLSAGTEGLDKITRNFKVQAYLNNQWTDIESITDNTDNLVDHTIQPVTASRFRLSVSMGEQGGNTARIYEFALYGQKESAGIEGVMTDSKSALTLEGNYPNPCTAGQTSVKYTCPEGCEAMAIEVYDLSGRTIRHQALPAAVSTQGSVEVSLGLSAGIYLYRLTGVSNGYRVASNAMRMIVK